jgi:hypothetical protein
MPQSRLFVSSVSRRDLARRRPGPPRLPLLLLLLLLVVIIACVVVFALGHGSF